MKRLGCGFLFGLIIPFVGVFIGLQVFPPLANVLLAPIIGIAWLTGTPLGMMSAELRLLSWLASALFWMGCFYLFGRIRQQTQRNPTSPTQ